MLVKRQLSLFVVIPKGNLRLHLPLFVSIPSANPLYKCLKSVFSTATGEGSASIFIDGS